MLGQVALVVISEGTYGRRRASLQGVLQKITQVGLDCVFSNVFKVACGRGWTLVAGSLPSALQQLVGYVSNG
jgi:hypothetical protein